MDWVANLHAWFLPMDHPLFLMLADPRRLRLTVRDALWIRLIDVAAALTARSYADAGTIVLELTDAFCPWNAGRWRISGKSTERTQQTPDLRADVTALASAYLGGFSWRQLAAASRVEELRRARSPRPTRSSARRPPPGARSYSERGGAALDPVDAVTHADPYRTMRARRRASALSRRRAGAVGRQQRGAVAP
jgi:hypothetical protein